MANAVRVAEKKPPITLVVLEYTEDESAGRESAVWSLKPSLGLLPTLACSFRTDRSVRHALCERCPPRAGPLSLERKVQHGGHAERGARAEPQVDILPVTIPIKLKLCLSRDLPTTVSFSAPRTFHSR